VRIEVHAKPRAKKTRLIAVRGNTLEIALAAPPVDGAANEELIRFLSDLFDIPKRKISLVRGETSRTKLLDIEDLDETRLIERTR
jgi:uncharacterized protein (TIGR00251 family)